jgi:hypothetical protein
MFSQALTECAGKSERRKGYQLNDTNKEKYKIFYIFKSNIHQIDLSGRESPDCSLESTLVKHLNLSDSPLFSQVHQQLIG